jgi:hypothetical protein
MLLSTLSAQSISFGFIGCAGFAPQVIVNNAQGPFLFDRKSGHFAQGGLFFSYQTKTNWRFRLSEQGTATQYGFRVDFDPALQPEVPISSYSVFRSWLTSRQASIDVGIPVLVGNKQVLIIAGIGLRRILSSGDSYSFVIGIAPNQSVQCFRSRVTQGGGNYLCGMLGAEKQIRIWKNYEISAGVIFQLTESPEAYGRYEYFPARTVSYSSGQFTVSSFSASFRLAAPVLWWKKKTPAPATTSSSIN